MRPTILVIPGWTNSGPEHWQTYFEQTLPNCVRVPQQNWEHPVADDWVECIEASVRKYHRNVVLLAHSLGGIAVAHWAKRRFGPVLGAMLVAPADLEADGVPEELKSFVPIPLEPFYFRTIVVASRTDPWLAFGRAKNFAEAWGADFIDIGPAGHVNTAAGYGPWPKGKEILAELLRSVEHLKPSELSKV